MNGAAGAPPLSANEPAPSNARTGSSVSSTGTYRPPSGAVPLMTALDTDPIAAPGAQVVHRSASGGTRDRTAKPQEIGEDAGRGDLGSGSRALHHERVRAVTMRLVAHDVVREVHVRERMVGPNDSRPTLAPARTSMAATYAQHLPASSRRPRARPSAHRSRVSRCQKPPRRKRPWRGGDQALHGDVGELQREARLAREDDGPCARRRCRTGRRAGRLRVTLRPRVAHDLRERPRPVEDVEQIRERAGQDATDAADLVAGRDQVLQRLDDGQARADGRFVQEMRARAAAQALKSS